MSFPTSRKMTKVYLAGPIAHSATGGHGWRDAVVNQWPDRFEWINPLDKYDYGEENDLSPTNPYDVKAVVEADKESIQEADVLFVAWNNDIRSRGTQSEMVLASEVYDIPVVVWNRVNAPEEDISFWTHYYADILSGDLPELFEYIEEL